MINIKEFIGLTEEQGKNLSTASNFVSRIVKRDDQNFMLTEDHRLDRLNFTIVKNIITNVSIG